MCACPITVSATGCRDVLCLIPCVCGKALEVTVELQYAPIVALPTSEAPEETGVIYEHLTMKRSRVLCPDCQRPHFVFGTVREIT